MHRASSTAREGACLTNSVNRRWNVGACAELAGNGGKIREQFCGVFLVCEQFGGNPAHLVIPALTRPLHPFAEPVLVSFVEKLHVPCGLQRCRRAKIEIGFNGVGEASRGALKCGVLLKGDIAPLGAHARRSGQESDRDV
jgi:hypothetical protein